MASPRCPKKDRRALQTKRRMIEEPYRWVEAIANRGEYIETQLAAGSPIAAVGYRDGILVSDARPAPAENFSRSMIGLPWARLGIPGDIERLRMAAIELASAEGFTRSAADVSLRRLAHYSLSPVLKDGVRAGLWRALSRPHAFRRNRRETGSGFVSAFGLRRRNCDQ